MSTQMQVAAERWASARTRPYFTLMLLVALVELWYLV
jgi:hypothetical protein